MIVEFFSAEIELRVCNQRVVVALPSRAGQKQTCLKVSQLQRGRGFGDDLGGLPQSARSLLFTFGGYDLKASRVMSEGAGTLPPAHRHGRELS